MYCLIYLKDIFLEISLDFFFITLQYREIVCDNDDNNTNYYIKC